MQQRVEHVLVADSFFKRWRGLRPRALGRRMLFRGSSVHGFGMKETLWAVGLDAHDVVIGVRRLDPRRVVRIRQAACVLELPGNEEPPETGTKMLISDSPRFG